MTILLATPNDEALGGVAYVIGNLARDLQKRGHEIVFLFPGKSIVMRPKTTQFGCRGFELRMQRPLGERNPAISLPAFLILFLIAMVQLIRLSRKCRIQIINVHYPTDCLFYLALCRRILRLSLVTSVHGADVFPGGKPQARYSLGYRFLLSSSDLIVAPSRRLQEDVVRLFPALKDRTLFIHNGVDLGELDGSRSHTKVAREPYILCISAYKEQKAIDVLLRAFKLVQRTDASVKLVLAGAGHLRRELEQLAKDLGIRQRVEFLGLQTRPEVAGLLRDCRVFVLPSRFETFGIAILEAMAFKKPVIATRVGGIPEIIEHGKNGILVEADDSDALATALIAVLGDRALQFELATNGSRTVRERFRSEQTSAAYEAVFADLLGAGERGIPRAA